MKIKEIGKNFALSVISMAVLYVWYAVVGVTDLGNWNHGLRNVLAGVIFVFAAQLVTGRSLFHPSWRPGLVIFYLWLGAFSYIQAKSGGNWGIRVEALNNDVLTLMPVLVLTFLMEYVGSLCWKIRPFLRVFNFLLIGYLSLSVFVYMTYYKIFGAGFTSTDMISVLLTNSKEAMEFLQSHLGFGSLGVVLALFAVYMVFIGWLIVKGSRIDEIGGVISPSLVRKIIIAVLTIAALVTVAHWIPRVFPAWPYHVAHKYLMNSAKMEKSHKTNIGNLVVQIQDKMPGTMILVIGESANKEHLKAFNRQYPADTTPWLSSVKEKPSFILYDKAYSNYPMTAQALSMYLTNRNQYNQVKEDSMITITDVANKAGYDTWWISNQTPSAGNVALALSARNSKEEKWTQFTGKDDMKVLDYLKEIPKEGNHFIIIHIEGSHDRYRDRVPPNFEKIKIDNHSTKINDYDTSILYTDKVLQEIYSYAKENLNLNAMVYCSDHGEDMEYFHGASHFTYDMVRVPFFIYLSPSYEQLYPETTHELKNHAHAIFTNDLMYDTLCGILHVPNSYYSSEYDLGQKDYKLTLNQALTMHGEKMISDDPVFSAARGN